MFERFKGANFTTFWKFNGWLTAAIIGITSIEGVRLYLLENIYPSVVLLSILEIIVIIYTIKQNMDEFDPTYLISANDFHKDSLEIRFATSDDDSGTESVYAEWFPDSLAIDDDQYNLIVRRGGFVRVVEAIYKNGSLKQHKIVGYYSVFPMAIDTYDKMRMGNLKEKDLTSSHVLDPSDPDAKVLYVPEICVS